MDRALGRVIWRSLFLVVLASGVTWFLSVAAARHGFFDLRVYYGALHYWARDGGQLYDYLQADTPYGYTYPPFAALVMAPMAYLGWHTTIVLSVIGSVLATAAVLWWLVAPVARRHGWSRWFPVAVALCLAAAYEPVRETVNFGQVNMLLLALVTGDLLWLVAGRSRYAGVGIGLATAVKLTPGLFIVYLLITRRWRAAAVAAGTALAATLLAGALAPGTSREFWTTAVWDTGRVGNLEFISNQSLHGMVSRADPGQTGAGVWLILVAATLTVWVWRVRAATREGALRDAATATRDTATRDTAVRDGALRDAATAVRDTATRDTADRDGALRDVADGTVRTGAAPATEGSADRVGLALTGVVACLVSPVTWVHHLVWLMPALVLVVSGALAAPAVSRRWRLSFAIIGYAVLSSRLIWRWEWGWSGLPGFLGSNAYVWASLALLFLIPTREPLPERSYPTSSARPARSPVIQSLPTGDGHSDKEPERVTATSADAVTARTRRR